MEARVAAGIGLLVAVAVGAVLLATMRAVASSSLTRANEDLEIARTTFRRSLETRTESAVALTRLITELPVFRAHITDSQLASDVSSMEEMSDRYRRQLNASFCIVTDANGRWIGQPGWPKGASAPSDLQTVMAVAVGGRAAHDIVAVRDRLYLVIAEPARFAEEVLGTLSVGYALDDAVAEQLAAATHCEVSLVVGSHLCATSLPAAERAALEQWLSGREAGALKSPRPAGMWRLGAERYVAGDFPLLENTARGNGDRLLLLKSWTPTQQFLDALRTQFFWAAAVVFVCALAIGFGFSSRTTRPLREIAAAAREIASGNWERRVPLRGSAEATTLAAAFNDMSASLRGAQERLIHDAFHDHLTQLPNRALFMDRLERVLARKARYPEYHFAVLFIDLDRFKTVNDSIGHPAGDRLLLDTAVRLSDVLRRHDIVARPSGRSDGAHNGLARVGGDEFTVLLEDIADPSDAVRVAERLQEALAAPVMLGGHEVFTSASIGIAVSGAGPQAGDDIVRDADIAMYRAKSAGGGGYALFDTTMHDRAVERLQLETDLRRALERHELRLYYQPIVSLATESIVGFEALVRWEHPQRGLLLPSAFIGVAEETGLITRIDAWVLGEACAEARRWAATDADLPPTSVSVNISAQGFGRPDFVQQVGNVLRETALDPRALRLEITESVAMADAERARVVLSEVRALGVRISLDDFGTGYSSLSYLQCFPVDTLKIDRSFVAALDNDDGCREIIRTILSLAQALGLDVIAEGTETDEQVAYLNSLACTYGQGYLFGMAQPADMLRAMAAVTMR